MGSHMGLGWFRVGKIPNSSQICQFAALKFGRNLHEEERVLKRTYGILACSRLGAVLVTVGVKVNVLDFIGALLS